MRERGGAAVDTDQPFNRPPLEAWTKFRKGPVAAAGVEQGPRVGRDDGCGIADALVILRREPVLFPDLRQLVGRFLEGQVVNAVIVAPARIERLR